MCRRQKQLVRVLALGLAVLLLLGTVVSIVFTHDHAHGEENRVADSFAIEAEFLEEAQALQIRQRLLYTNGTGQALDRVEFAVYGNMFRRQSALMYEGDVWPDVFPQGNAVGGLEFSQVLFDGEAADWGMLDENELFMRVACDLEPGETGEFLFEYTILLTQNAASLGVGESDWRLRGFYVQPLKFEGGEFVATSPLQQTNYVYAGRADYTFSITLPERYFQRWQWRWRPRLDAFGDGPARTVRKFRHALAGIRGGNRFGNAPARACFQPSGRAGGA